MASPIELAMRQICEEKGLAYESVLDAIQSALAAAYRKDFGDKNQNIETEFDPQDGSVRVFDVKTVVEDIDPAQLEAAEVARRERGEAIATKIEQARAKGEPIPAITFEEDDGPRFNPKTEIMLTQAKEHDPQAELNTVVRMPLDLPGDFGRMAAMTAKQVITQKLREAEREIVFSEFKEKEHQVMQGTVQRREGRVVLVDIGRTTGIMRGEDQIYTERYLPGERLSFYVRQVALTSKGPEILLSRTSDELVQTLFEFEIPEIADGAVKIKGIAREPGSRSKVAVHTDDPQIDPIGACIGQRGTRIQTIIAELGGEKIDIVEWSDDPQTLIVNALSPASITAVKLNEKAHVAVVSVPEDQLSLAIGKGGQNVRLAAKLSGWAITIDGAAVETEQTDAAAEEGGESQTQEGVLSETDEIPQETEVERELASEVVEAAPEEETKEAKEE